MASFFPTIFGGAFAAGSGALLLTAFRLKMARAAELGGLDSAGPMRAATFLGREADDGFKADVVGLVARLVEGLHGA